MQSNEVRSCVALAVRREQAGAGARESLAVLCSLLLAASLPSLAAAAAGVSADAADTGLEEITVTAEKYNSTIQNTPISLSALSGEQLDSRGRKVRAGDILVLVRRRDSFVDELVRARSQERQSGLSSLTPRETEILAEMAQGKSNAAIAVALTVTERAVEKHTNSIFSKLGLSEEKDVNRRVKAVLLFLSEPASS